MKVALAVAAVVALLAALGFLHMVRRGFSAHDDPSAIEAVIARSLRSWSTPAELRDADNPAIAMEKGSSSRINQPPIRRSPFTHLHTS
jgi:hypothetical protein